MKYNYIYKLGHINDLALAELNILNGGFQQGQFYFSDEDLNIEKFGSIISKAKLVASYDNLTSEELESKLLNYVESLDSKKKFGLILLKKFFDKNWINKLKEKGIKKLNLIYDQELNYGHWKSTKNRIQLVQIQKKYYLLHVEQMFDQEKWALLDTNLPVSDMRRGMINLKLARSLVNLTKLNNIYDPFGGIGRVLISAMDIKESFMISDIDSTCVIPVKQNWKFATGYLKLDKKLIFNEVVSAQNISKLASQIPNNTAIVTEGYLGTNFNQKPSKQQIISQYDDIENMWIDTLQGLGSVTQIKEIIFCYPYYLNDGQTADRALENLISRIPKTWRMIKLTNETKYIIYKRPKTLVGHTIFKLVRD